jgi:hypothetical protein
MGKIDETPRGQESRRFVSEKAAILASQVFGAIRIIRLNQCQPVHTPSASLNKAMQEMGFGWV